MGVDPEGGKHVPGLAEGASENAVVARGLFEDLARRGVKPDRRRLFSFAISARAPNDLISTAL